MFISHISIWLVVVIYHFVTKNIISSDASSNHNGHELTTNITDTKITSLPEHVHLTEHEQVLQAVLTNDVSLTPIPQPELKETSTENQPNADDSTEVAHQSTPQEDQTFLQELKDSFKAIRVICLWCQ